MPARWSKLQKELYQIITDTIHFQIHCSAYRMDSQYGNTNLPRYWIILDKEIVFDYPKQFVTPNGTIKNLSGVEAVYPYKTDICDISDLIRTYIDTPKEHLLSMQFEDDHWGLVNILRAADKRIGTRRLSALKRKTDNLAARKIIAARLRASASTDDSCNDNIIC